MNESAVLVARPLLPFIPRVICTIIAGLFFFAGVRWILDHRTNGIFDLDENSYLSIAVTGYLALSKGGLASWFEHIAASIHAPLTPAAASLVFAAAGIELHYGLFVPLAFATVAIVTTYLLVSGMSGPYAGLSAAALTATVPMIVVSSRSFHFAMAATAVLALTLLAAVRSERFSRTGWSIAFGILLGLLPLARTMAIAFVPGILLGVAFNIVASKPLAGRLIRFAIALGIAALTAATWLAFSWEGVFGYLTGWGYGTRAVEYGASIPFLTAATLLRAVRLFTHALFLPHFILIAVGLAAGLVVVGGVIYRRGWDAIGEAARSPVVVLASTVLCGAAALVSTPNTGETFVAPLAPPVIALAVCWLWSAWPAPLYRGAVATASAGVAVAAALPYLGVYGILPPRKAVPLPFVGYVAVSDNRGAIDFYIAAASPRPIDPAAWTDLIARTNAAIGRQGEGAVACGFRHSIYVSGLALNHLVTTGIGRQFIGPDPVGTGNTAQGYRTWLSTGWASNAKMLLTSPGSEGEPLPLVDHAAFEEAARSAGFVPVDTWAMPNGRPVTLWKRQASQ